MTASTTIAITVTSGGATLSVNPSLVRPRNDGFPNSAFTVTVSGGPGNTTDWIALAAAGAPVGSYVFWSYLNGTQTPPAVGLSSASFSVPAPGPAGNYEVRWFASNGYTLITAPAALLAADLITASLFPTSFPQQSVYVKVTSPVQASLASASVVGQVGAGTRNVTLDIVWTSDNGPVPANGSVTMVYMANDQPISPYTVGPPFTYTFDSSVLADGTYAFSALWIDSTSADYTHAQMAYQFLTTPMIVIVANAGFNNGAQTVPCTDTGFNRRLRSSGVDYLTYGGNPSVIANPAHPYPTQNILPAFNPSSPYHSNPALLRDPANWYMETIDRTGRTNEYETTNGFYTTKQGGVFISGYQEEESITLEGSYDGAVRHLNFDGGRNDNTTDPYSNFVEAPDGSGFVGVDIAGRVYKVAWNGAVTTLVGQKRNRAVLPYSSYDRSIAEADLDTRLTTIGTKNFTSDFRGTNDLCYDPRNPNILYVAKTLDHFIYKVDLTNPSAPVCTRYAGQDGVAGHADGNALTTAAFNEPYSICMQARTNVPGHPQGTMYVADNRNCRICMISPDGSTVSTLFGNQTNLPDTSFSGGVNFTLWCPNTADPFSDAYAVFPQVLRMASTGNIVLGESWSLSARLIDLTAQTVKRIGQFEGSQFPGYNFGGLAWFWIDVDSAGACGPVDDIILFSADAGDIGGNASAIGRMSIDGSYNGRFGGDSDLGAKGGSTEDGGGGGHYPWLVAFSKTQGRIVTGGFANLGLFSWRIRQSNDPSTNVLTNQNIDSPAMSRGRAIWDHGSVVNWPYGARPTFRNLYGPTGCAHLGLGTLDDVVAAYPTDAALGGFIQAGMGGSVPRPEITGDDLRDLIYYIRRISLSGSYPVPLAVPQGQASTDVTAPVISGLTAVRLSSTSIRVNWTTDKPTIGFAAAGSPSATGTSAPYNRWALENAFSTTHSVTLTNLSPVTPTHYAVLSKDVAGNSAASGDQSI